MTRPRLICFEEVTGSLNSITFWCWWDGKNLRVASNSTLRKLVTGVIVSDPAIEVVPRIMRVKRLTDRGRTNILSRVHRV